MQYDEDMLNEINQNVDLVEYVGQQMELRKQGGDYFAHCPMHVDQTASLSLNKESNMYYCFSCGRGGGIIGWLMDYEGLRFDQAVEKAAKLANVDLSKMCTSETIQFLKKLKAWSRNKREPFQHKILPESEYEQYQKLPVQEWLDEGISQATLDRFDIRVDDFHNRIVYPVRDIDGHLINVKARTRYQNYKALRIPKYINYFQVGVMDYFQSLDMALPKIREKNEVIIFESIKSTMKAYDWGYDNCVSAEKHTLTNEQITLLVKLKTNVVFAYDSDVSYWSKDVRTNLNKLRRFTNVFILEDREKLLGGVEAKNSPADCGRDIFERLLANRRKVIAI